MTVPERDPRHGEPRPSHVAVGYANRRDLDRFIEGEQGDLVVHGPLHTIKDIADVATIGPGATEGMPCVVVPLIRERMDEIRQEVLDVMHRFGTRRVRPGEERPHTIEETGGSVRGTTTGAIRTGSLKPDA